MGRKISYRPRMSEPSRLQEELHQTRPFHSKAQEAALSIVRTADCVRRHFQELIEPHGITVQQYNVLRILRGVHPEPLPTLEIAGRLIEQTPGITRLLDRLDAKGLVRRQRCVSDRRMVHCWITDAGLSLLKSLDSAVNQADEEVMRGLGSKDIEILIGLLERVRAGL